ncbi:unnamed protein product [Linum tenue]|uniref:Cytochrome P450 n=1 Tax=Linum tenue TaxID=586396 RepID=A0AAV0IG27_9ROSI|nr:unnamed protein product [Linum tenue]
MWVTEVVCVVLGWVVVALGQWVYRWRNPKCDKGTLPPGSMGLPFIGETFQLFSRSKSFDVPLFLSSRIQK